jgi:hypothetical protein
MQLRISSPLNSGAASTTRSMRSATVWRGSEEHPLEATYPHQSTRGIGRKNGEVKHATYSNPESWDLMTSMESTIWRVGLTMCRQQRGAEHHQICLTSTTTSSGRYRQRTSRPALRLQLHRARSLLAARMQQSTRDISPRCRCDSLQ